MKRRGVDLEVSDAPCPFGGTNITLSSWEAKKLFDWKKKMSILKAANQMSEANKMHKALEKLLSRYSE